jgi:hypothetical protein
VAASLGEPVAAKMDAFVEANPPAQTVVDLERAIAARGWAARVPGAVAVAAVTIDGRRMEVGITPDEPARYRLTPAQAAALRLEPVRGSVLVIITGESPLDPAGLVTPTGVSVNRVVKPAGVIGSTDTVLVTYRVDLAADALGGCWPLVDFVPSGLVPVDGGVRWNADEEGSGDRIEYPWRVEGQRVDFCATRDPQHPDLRLRYLARVVTPGTYRWESTVLQSSIAPEQGIILPPTEVTIRGAGS